MLAYPHINPIALKLGPLAIRWYALAYLTGVMTGWWLIGKLSKRMREPVLTKPAFDDIMVYAILGIVLGGRLGYICFYKPAFYLSHPLEIFMVWQGGMSFHGGLLGMITAMVLFSRRFTIPFLGVMDLLAVAAPIGLFCGRLANFVNGELYGRATDSRFAMIFPTDPDQLPRYPSQLIEAGLEGIALFLMMLALALGTRALDRRGCLSGFFLLGYWAARSTSEFFREPDAFIGFLPGGITMGQLLSVPMLLIGVFMIVRSRASRA